MSAASTSTTNMLAIVMSMNITNTDAIVTSIIMSITVV